MKLAMPPTYHWSIGEGRNAVQLPPIPFERVECLMDKDKENVCIFKLRTNPNSDESPMYNMRVLTFKSGTAEEYVRIKCEAIWYQCDAIFISFTLN